MKKMEGYAVIYKNDDDTFSFGKFIHKTPECAIDNIPIFEGALVADTVKVTFEYDETKLLPGLEYRQAEQERQKTNGSP